MPKIPMEAIEEAINDLDMAGGEISYRVSDLLKSLEGRNLKGTERARIVAAARKACELVNSLGSIRKQIGLPERPEEYRRVPPGNEEE